MAEHVRFSVDTDIDVYFCDPHSPWQRGSNENTNGLAASVFSETADLSVYTRADLASVARQLNTRPRHTLGWKKPAEVFCLTVVSTG
jgi:IS30 family transposase